MTISPKAKAQTVSDMFLSGLTKRHEYAKWGLGPTWAQMGDKLTRLWWPCFKIWITAVCHSPNDIQQPYFRKWTELIISWYLTTNTLSFSKKVCVSKIVWSKEKKKVTGTMYK